MNPSAEPELVLDGGAPIQEQIESQVRRLIVRGILRPGEELPTIRALAVGLTIAPIRSSKPIAAFSRAAF